MVSAFFHAATAALSASDAYGLQKLGFRVRDPALPSPALVVSSTSVGVRVVELGWVAFMLSHVIPSGVVTRSLIELCCSADSRLGATRPESADCARYRFTEREDLTSAPGLREALLAVHESQARCKGHLLIWVSIPCTGGCQWNRVNARFPTAQLKKDAHIALFQTIWTACARIMEYAVASGGATLAIEWPRQCEYWGLPIVQEFLTKHELTLSYFDGCMYGLVGHRGVPLKKPWCVASNSRFVGDTLNLRCKGGHAHDCTSGVDAKTSEGYTEHMVECVHRTFGQDCAKSPPTM